VPVLTPLSVSSTGVSIKPLLVEVALAKTISTPSEFRLESSSVTTIVTKPAPLVEVSRLRV